MQNVADKRKYGLEMVSIQLFLTSPVKFYVLARTKSGPHKVKSMASYGKRLGPLDTKQEET